MAFARPLDLNQPDESSGLSGQKNQSDDNDKFAQWEKETITLETIIKHWLKDFAQSIEKAPGEGKEAWGDHNPTHLALYRKAFQDYGKSAQAYKQAFEWSKTVYKINKWLSVFAVFITPLSLFVTIPLLLNRKWNARWAINMALVLGGLIPVLSGFLSWAAAELRQDFKLRDLASPPRPSVVRKIVNGTPEQIKARHHAEKQLFKEKHPSIFKEEKGAFSSSTKGIMKIIDEGHFNLFPTTDEYQFTEHRPTVSDDKKPHKIYVPLIVNLESSPMTAIYMDREKEKRWEIVENQQSHQIIGKTSDNCRLLDASIPQKEDNELSAEATSLFFWHSKIASYHNVAQLEKRYQLELGV